MTSRASGVYVGYSLNGRQNEARGAEGAGFRAAAGPTTEAVVALVLNTFDERNGGNRIRRMRRERCAAPARSWI